jgi:hypothetical protein
VAGVASVSIGTATAGADDRRFEGWGRSVGSIAQAQRLARTDQAITLIGEPVRGRSVDIGADGPSPGDLFFFEEKLYNESHTKVVGKDSVRCQAGVRTYICDATFRLEGRGKIVVSSAFFARRDNTAPVTGGSRHFKGVGGVLQVFGLPGGESVYFLKLVR